MKQEWPSHCGRPMLYLGDDSAFDRKAGKDRESQETGDPNQSEYVCESCGSRLTQRQSKAGGEHGSNRKGSPAG